jgi:hypothetical protein
MNDNNHISKTDLYAFQHNIMKQDDKEQFLEHICSCDYCADQFATMMSEEIITAPKYMKDNIMKAVKRPEIILAAKARETSKRMQLFIYTLKVGTATICALLLLLLTMNFPSITDNLDLPLGVPAQTSTDDKSLTSSIRDSMDIISSNMLHFSNNIMKTEVTTHDQKEK